MREIRTVLTAIQFYTILPVPAFEFRPEYFERILRYSSLVGLLVGGLGALIFLAAESALPVPVAVCLSLLATAVVTGCFHEDGFADFCDGMHAPGGRAQKLEAMRDSRMGPAGATGAILLLLLRFAGLAAIAPEFIAIALLVGHSVSRFLSAIYVFDIEYSTTEASQATAGGAQASGIKPTITDMSGSDLMPGGLLAAGALGFAGLYFPEPLALLAIPLLLSGAYLVFRRVLLRTLGGYTGDCLGAAQQIFETTIYLSFAALPAIAGFTAALAK